MTRVRYGLLSVMALVCVALLGAPGAASAAPTDYPTAYNTKTQYLVSNPHSGMAGSCVSRRITLGTGHYDWGHVMGARQTVVRANLYLGQGVYTWEDCLWPHDGFYVQTTSLNPDNPDWDTVYLSEDLDVRSTGTWTWGGFLDPRF